MYREMRAMLTFGAGCNLHHHPSHHQVVLVQQSESRKGHLDGTMKTLPFASQFTAEGYLHKCTRLRHIPPRHLFGCISSSSFLHCTALPHPAPSDKDEHIFLSNLRLLNIFRRG